MLLNPVQMTHLHEPTGLTSIKNRPTEEFGWRYPKASTPTRTAASTTTARMTTPITAMPPIAPLERGPPRAGAIMGGEVGRCVRGVGRFVVAWSEGEGEGRGGGRAREGDIERVCEWVILLWGSKSEGKLVDV